MGFLQTHSGRIWGSAQQKASVKKAAEASAAKRRKYNAADVTSGGRMKSAAPQRAIAEDAEDMYNKPAQLTRNASKGGPSKPSKAAAPRSKQLDTDWNAYLRSKGIKPNDPSSAHISESTHPDLYAGFTAWLKRKVKPNVVPVAKNI